MFVLENNGFKISISPQEKTIYADEGERLSDILESAGMGLNTLCGNGGRCGKCFVKIENGIPPRITSQELEKIPHEELTRGIRLACQVKVQGDMDISIPPESMTNAPKLQMGDFDFPFQINLHVRKYLLDIERIKSNIESSEDENLLEVLHNNYGVKADISYHAIKELPDLLKNNKDSITAVIRGSEVGGSEVFALESSDTTKKNFGVAIDLGTTKIAGFLLELNSGRIISTASISNPQKIFGSDIISRVAYASKNPEALKDIQYKASKGINEIIDRLLSNCKEKSINREHIYYLTLVGNTVMVHILLGLDPGNLGRSPFTPVMKKGIEVDAKDLEIRINPRGSVYLLPVIGGFVGADAVGVSIATGINNSTDNVLVLDIGTNNEILLNTPEGIISSSSPSGPAFEGGHISHGMKASKGAIESIYIDHLTKRLEFETIGGKRPRGICGTGIIDLVSELLKAGIVSRRGHFRKDSTDRVRKNLNGFEFVVARADETGINKDIIFTQNDMAEFMKAKAAVHSATRILMEQKKIGIGELDKILLAGAFGSYIKPESARTVGLIPAIAIDKIESVGNMAGLGAVMVLVSEDMRYEAEKISRQIDHFNIEKHKDFAKEFLSSMYLPHRDPERFVEVEAIINNLKNKIKNRRMEIGLKN